MQFQKIFTNVCLLFKRRKIVKIHGKINLEKLACMRKITMKLTAPLPSDWFTNVDQSNNSRINNTATQQAHRKYFQCPHLI